MSYGEEFLSDHAYEIEHGLPIKELAIPSHDVNKKGKKKMAQKVLILGDSGTGKSASLRNFKPEEILVINAAGKPLPFKNHFECITPSFEKMTQDVLKAMDATKKKVIVIDDAQYIMSFQYMRRIKENGWDKWNDIQGDFFNIIKACDYMPEDVIVYFLSHLQRDDEGHEKIKTMGKMLDEKITIEGLFTTVLKTAVKDGQYFFLTQNSGLDTVKSPIGMFPTYAIENDLKYVDTKIRNYYEIGEYKDDEEIKKMDEETASEAIQKPDSDGRRRRKRAAGSDSKDDGEKPEVTAEKTDDAVSAAPVAETASEQPKTRRRKARNVTADDSPAEPEKPAETPENAPQPASKEDLITAVAEGKMTEAEAHDAYTNAPKRRRRRKKQDDIDLSAPLDINDDELPF